LKPSQDGKTKKYLKKKKIKLKKKSRNPLVFIYQCLHPPFKEKRKEKDYRIRQEVGKVGVLF